MPQKTLADTLAARESIYAGTHVLQIDEARYPGAN